ncbi:DUF4405 domain-containing protein [Ructibacterium gallinarum]|uniref:DUF4405 domain-containing protein n=1 Tax=Ructibacterium gallinarum TaxID=2779355 RepID=A0A9D5M831_9FIRM|nr:DUF4405 domain-containing protein [Ructibacterium gallinarum]MBE5041269.1 DUF4405 domain-containing protein [Ructibacterium gallinarum]
MKQKQNFKLALDIIMLLLSVTFFNKSLISLSYHEIAGLILIGIFVLHIVINLKAISVMCRKFVKVPAETKAGVVVDFLLILCFAWIGISGIMISKTILTGISSNHMVFKLGHMFAGGLSVVLLGVHIGLHICHRRFPAAAAVLLSAVILCGGVYGTVNSSQLRWLSIPFSAALSSGEEGGKRPAEDREIEKNAGSAEASAAEEGAGQDEGSAKRPEIESNSAEVSAAEEGAGQDEGSAKRPEIESNSAEASAAEEGAGQDEGSAKRPEIESNSAEASAAEERTEEAPPEGRPSRDAAPPEEGASRPKGGTVPLSQRLESVWMFLSMILSCAVVTYWIVRAKKAIQAKKKA